MTSTSITTSAVSGYYAGRLLAGGKLTIADYGALHLVQQRQQIVSFNRFASENIANNRRIVQSMENNSALLNQLDMQLRGIGSEFQEVNAAIGRVEAGIEATNEVLFELTFSIKSGFDQVDQSLADMRRIGEQANEKLDTLIKQMATPRTMEAMEQRYFGLTCLSDIMLVGEDRANRLASDAKTSFSKALTINPFDYASSFYLGWISQFIESDVESAAKQYETAALHSFSRDKPFSVLSHQKLAEALLELGQPDKAMWAIREGNSLDAGEGRALSEFVQKKIEIVQKTSLVELESYIRNAVKENSILLKWMLMDPVFGTHQFFLSTFESEVNERKAKLLKTLASKKEEVNRNCLKTLRHHLRGVVSDELLMGQTDIIDALHIPESLTTVHDFDLEKQVKRLVSELRELGCSTLEDFYRLHRR